MALHLPPEAYLWFKTCHVIEVVVGLPGGGSSIWCAPWLPLPQIDSLDDDEPAT